MWERTGRSQTEFSVIEKSKSGRNHGVQAERCERYLKSFEWTVDEHEWWKAGWQRSLGMFGLDWWLDVWETSGSWIEKFNTEAKAQVKTWN